MNLDPEFLHAVQDTLQIAHRALTNNLPREEINLTASWVKYWHARIAKAIEEEKCWQEQITKEIERVAK